jgi:hypothetical protein
LICFELVINDLAVGNHCPETLCSGSTITTSRRRGRRGRRSRRIGVGYSVISNDQLKSSQTIKHDGGWFWSCLWI